MTTKEAAEKAIAEKRERRASRMRRIAAADESLLSVYTRLEEGNGNELEAIAHALAGLLELQMLAAVDAAADAIDRESW